MDGCLTTAHLTKDRAAKALRHVMIPQALDNPHEPTIASGLGVGNGLAARCTTSGTAWGKLKVGMAMDR
jgi:hypothetical protein